MMKTMRQVFGETLAEMAEEYPEMVVLDADVSSSTQTRIFQERYPERFFNFGIAEANMVSAAAGMSTCKKIPVVSSFAFLLSMRALDQVRSLIVYNGLNVKLCGGYAGLSDFADGASHQSVCDLAIMRSLPGMTVLAPSDESTTKAALHEMMRIQGPVYLRLSRAEIAQLHSEPVEVRSGKMTTIISGRDCCLITTGTMLENALNARKMLENEGYSIGLMEAISIKPMDTQAIREVQKSVKCLITIEEHNIIGGLGDAVCAALAGEPSVPVFRIGLNDCFGQSARNYAQLLSQYGLDAASIAEKVRGFLRQVKGLAM